jgi:hypothetical protein
MQRATRVRALALIVAGMTSSAVLAAAPQDILAGLEKAARAQDGRFAGFSAQRGQQFFNAKHGSEWSCASCHTSNPAQGGTHARTQKAISPLAPAGDARRFTDAAKVDKWFGRNCKDVLARACTPQEQGDVLAYLLTVKPQAGAQ